ncbi:ubiquitin-like domain-containing protein [Dysosmobacter welbionis]|uniref:ubiquitin-like domain-containing protein n=1 Tax=Dysosmobacter welbionis TaxID=2093857 RepID=UPI00300F49C3
MNTHAFEKKLHSLKARFGLQLFVLAAVVCTSWIVTDHANAVYILTGPEDAAIVLNEEEVREGEMSSQLVYLSSGQSGYDMALTAGQEVTVTHDGSTVTAKARSETVAELLERLHITPSPLEMVAVDSGRGQRRADHCLRADLLRPGGGARHLRDSAGGQSLPAQGHGEGGPGGRRRRPHLHL